jgi:hypothetical protein
MRESVRFVLVMFSSRIALQQSDCGTAREPSASFSQAREGLLAGKSNEFILSNEIILSNKSSQVTNLSHALLPAVAIDYSTRRYSALIRPEIFR